MNTAFPVLKPPNAPEPQGELGDISSARFLNGSAIRDHALRCSARFKGNRFTRVGQDFIDEIKVDVESFIRKEIRSKWPTRLYEPLEPDVTTTTGLLGEKLLVELNRAICRLIQSKVCSHPTVGKTLSRTR